MRGTLVCVLGGGGGVIIGAALFSRLPDESVLSSQPAKVGATLYRFILSSYKTWAAPRSMSLRGFGSPKLTGFDRCHRDVPHD